MGFMDSYKSLEKLCCEIYGNNRGLSSYIDEMTKNPMGSFYVSTWNSDLGNLKHYRWMRNQIVHDPSCNEDNMCEAEDAEWIEDFRSRIMSVCDPLALYRKAKSPTAKQTYSTKTSNTVQYRSFAEEKPARPPQVTFDNISYMPRSTYTDKNISYSVQRKAKRRGCLMTLIVVAIIVFCVSVLIVKNI